MTFDAEAFALTLQQQLRGTGAPAAPAALPAVVVSAMPLYEWRLTPRRDPTTGLIIDITLTPIARVKPPEEAP